MPLCECSVVSTSPLVLKYSAEQKEQPVILAALAGFPCRIDKMATRTTFSRTLSALHCLLVQILDNLGHWDDSLRFFDALNLMTTTVCSIQSESL